MHYHSLFKSFGQVVYIVRNPRDAMMSYYNFYKLFIAFGYTGDLNKFARYFMNDEGELTRVHII